MAAFVAVVAIVLAVLPRPPLDNSIESMLVDDSPRAQRYADFQQTFGADEVLVVHASAPDAPALFDKVVALERALGDDPGVAATLGPATAYADEFDILLDPDMGGWSEAERLSTRFGGPLGGALGLVDLSPPTAVIYAFCRPGRPHDRHRIEALVQAFDADLAAMGGVAHVAGPPVLNLALDRAGRSVETRSLPILIGVCVVLLLMLTRSPRIVVAALVPVGLGVLATEGLLTVVGLPTDIVVNIAKPLLFVLLLATALHVIVAWQDARRRGESRERAPWIAAREKRRACALALGTTALGFASLGFSDMPSIRRFGMLAAVGLAVGLPLVLCVLPGLLQVLGGRAAPIGGRRLGGLAAWLVDRSLRAGWTLPALAAIVTAAGLCLAPSLPVSTGGVHYFDTDARVRVDYEALAAAGIGLSTVEVIIDAGALVDGRPSEDALTRLDAFGRALEALSTVKRAIGLPLFLREGNWRMTGQDVVPGGPALAEALESAELGLFVKAGTLRLSLLIEHLDAPELDTLYAEIERLAVAYFPSDALTLTGHHEMVVQAQAALVDTLLWSLTTTAILIELIILVALRSFRLALAAILPMLAPVSLNFVLMWALDVPLDIGTCMTGAIALGIAVDDALHFMVAWQKSPPRITALGTGRALILTSVVIAAGFASLMGAPFEPTARFGLLCAVAMVSALLADLLVLPPLLQRLAPFRGEAEPAG